MTFHSFIEYLKYKWRAKGLHGTHSPFVYDFVAHVLQDYEIIPREYIVMYPSLALRFENIVSRTVAYYKYKVVLRLPAEHNDDSAGSQADMLLISGAEPGRWETLYSEYIDGLKNEGAIVVMDIHSTMAHTSAWNKLCNAAGVKMSLDLYGIGILLFRDEFMVKQQFVLRY